MGTSANASVNITWRNTGLPQVQAGMQAVRAEAGPAAEQWSMASRRIAFGLEEAARHGELAGRSLREIVASGAEMATGFSAAGPIVAGIAVVGFAIYEHITKGLEEARKKVRDFQDELAKLGKGRDAEGAIDLLQNLQRGDPFAGAQGEKESANDYYVRSKGLEGLQARRKALLEMETITQASAGTGPDAKKNATFEDVTKAAKALVGIRKQLADVNALIIPQEAKIAEAMKTQASTAAENLPLGFMDRINSALSDKLTGPGSSISMTQRSNKPEDQSPNGPLQLQLARYGSNPTEARIFTMLARAAWLRKAIASGTLSPDEMLAAIDELGNVQQAGRMGMTPQFKDLPKNPVKGLIGTGGDAVDKSATQGFVKLGHVAAETFVTTFADAIEAGMAAVFAKGGNLGGVFRAVSATVLAGIGHMAIDVGKTSLMTLSFMKTIKTAMEKFAPELGFASALGLIALGSALVAGAGSIGGGGGGSSAGGYGGSSYGAPPQIIDRGYIDPTRHATTASTLTPRGNMVFAPTIIGVNDPIVMRQLQTLLYNAGQRGNV